MLDEGSMAQTSAKTVKQQREEENAALQDAVSFHCLVEEWKDCEELMPKPKEKLIFVDKKWEAQQVSMLQMRMRQQVHEDPREMHRAEVLVRKLGKIGKATLVGGHDLVRRLDRAGGGPDLVQKVFGMCEAENGDRN